MDRALLILAAIGIVLLWMRAKPIQPMRTFLTVRLNRSWEWMVIGRWRVCRIPAWPIWWLKGVLGCGECLSPYVGLIVGLVAGERLWAIPIGLATYAVFVMTERHSA